MDSDLTNRLTQELKRWSTSQLYVGDQYEFRANTKLNLVSSKIQFNSFSLYGKVYPLPTNQGCFVFSFPIQVLRGLETNTTNDTWMDGAEYLNSLQTRLFVYDNFGKLFPLGQIYIKKTCTRMFLVITKNAYLACASNGVNSLSEMYLTFWVNPHPENPITVTEFYPQLDSRTQTWGTDNNSVLNYLHQINDTDTTFTSVLVNGVFTPIKNISLGTKDYISVIKETDIFCKFDVTIDDNVTGYESTLYQDYREILHMPKALNPNKYILTHDLLDVIIKDPDTNKGLYLSRYDYRSVRQITHQDYSIDRTDADSLRDALHASSVVASVVVRNPVNKRALKNDVNYISDLYRNDEDIIVKLLRNSYVTGMDFWSAANLEASKYISLIFTNTIKDQPSSDGSIPTLSDYLSALGYYNTITVLDGGVSVGSWDDSTLVAKAPVILQGRNLLPYVFTNGRKELQTNLNYTIYDGRKIELKLEDKVLKDGDKISVLLKDFTDVPVVTFKVTSDNTVYKPTSDNFTIYEQVNGTYSTVSRSTSTYRSDIVDGVTELTFYPPMYDKTVYVFYDNRVAKGIVELDDLIDNKGSLVFKLYDSNKFPILGYNTLDVFLNGYWCVKDIDYCIYPDSESGVYTLAITNRNFLKLDSTGNVLEWFVYGDKTVNDDFDYIVDNELRHQQTPYLFERNVSEVYSEGLYLTDVINEGSYLSTENQSQASVGEHLLRFPYILYNALPETDRASDDAKRVSISNFFKTTSPSTPPQVILNSQHQVYSPWLHYLIISLINGTIVGVNDPDVVAFIKQFPSVNGLKEHDPTLYRNNRMNRDYLAIAAAYTLDMPDVAVSVRTIIQKLISLTLVRDMSSLGVTAV